jgi:hypothetical protein
VKKTRIVHFQGLSALNMQKDFLFVLSLEHASFELMENIPQKKW